MNCINLLFRNIIFTLNLLNNIDICIFKVIEYNYNEYKNTSNISWVFENLIFKSY